MVISFSGMPSTELGTVRSNAPSLPNMRPTFVSVDFMKGVPPDSRGNVRPVRMAYLPVTRPMRDGVQSDAEAYESVNRIPSRASVSMFGVRRILSP